MKGGHTSLLKHRLTENPMGTTNKQISLWVHWQSMAASTATVASDRMESVRFVSTFQANSAHFALIFMSLLFPAEGAPDQSAERHRPIEGHFKSFLYLAFPPSKAPVGVGGNGRTQPPCTTGSFSKISRIAAPGWRESRTGQEEWLLTRSG